MNVYITVDTEMWPNGSGPTNAADDFRRWIVGHTPKGEYGLPFQLRILQERNLQATYFVEALFPDALGRTFLDETVAMISSADQDIQLHIHPEWLSYVDGQGFVRDRQEQLLGNLSLELQTKLIARGIENLRAAGVENVIAFRAGNYGAGDSTLLALAQNGIVYDSSFNPCYLRSACTITHEASDASPFFFGNLVEIPIACFQDYPGHYRHTQLRACSSAELQYALLQASERGWEHFVIVSHSFELLNSALTAPDRIVVARYESLCDFLAANRNVFTTTAFRSRPTVAPASQLDRLNGSLWNTSARFFEQAWRRVA
jgi:hypothetical protein